VVVSFGGGGFRLFGATTVLKALDKLVQDRSQIGEVWGSSGGALLGYVYAMGFSADTLEELGSRPVPRAQPEPERRQLHQRRGVAREGDAARPARQDDQSDMMLWLEELDRKQPVEKRLTARVPFFSMGTNPSRGGLAALAAPEHIPPRARTSSFVRPARRGGRVDRGPLLLRAQQASPGSMETTPGSTAASPTRTRSRSRTSSG